MKYLGDTPSICKKCGQPKTRSESGRLRCYPCENAYQHQYYEKNIVECRKKSAKNMDKWRNDPTKRERLKEISRKSYSKNGLKSQHARLAKLKIEDPWKWKTWRIHPDVRGKLDKNELKSLYDKQNGKCALTGKELDFWTMELDHIIPKSRGGLNVLSNVQWTGSIVNQAKRNLLEGEFIELCKEVVLHRSW